MSEIPRYGRPLPPGRLLLLGLEEPPLGRRPRLLNADVGLQGCRGTSLKRNCLLLGS